MKKCKTCDNCKSIYRLALFRHYKCEKHYCVGRNDLTNAEGCCERWKRKRRENVDLSSGRFDEVIEDIKYLMEYFTER